MDKDIKSLNEKAKEHSKKLSGVVEELQKIIVGQDDVVRKVVLALVADGHVVLEGVPGLAKTLMIKTLADSCNTSFCRIQFTPDILPADIVGTKIYDQRKGTFYTQRGPIFHNFILADEINRAPPKVQSALLEAMQERQVSIHGETFILQKPFLVMATQNPIESEGTYKLPEAQIDRFMFKLLIDYPKKSEEKDIIKRNTQGLYTRASRVIGSREIIEMQDFCKKVYADEKIEDYVTEIVDATRHPKDHGLDIESLIEYGASPRASIWLIMASKANAMMSARGYVIPEDVRFVVHDVLRHRIILTYEAESEEIDSDDVIEKIVSKIRSP